MILERLLVTERLRRRSTQSGGFAVPGLQERPGDPKEGPFVATNMRGGILLTRPSREGCVRYGFSDVPLEQEDQFFLKLLDMLWLLSENQGWTNRCDSIPQAYNRMGQSGYSPRALVIPYPLLQEASGSMLSPSEAANMMKLHGYVAQSQGMDILVADIPAGHALLVTSPPLVGFYTRMDNHLGILLQRANQTLMMVRHAVD
jgi:hypothetical protein